MSTALASVQTYANAWAALTELTRTIKEAQPMSRIGGNPGEQSDEQLADELHEDAVAGVPEPTPDPWAGRHMSVQHFQQLFDYKHLPEGLQHVSAPFKTLATDLLNLGDGPELSACLRKLLEAKDCAVRQALQDGFGEITRVRSGR